MLRAYITLMSKLGPILKALSDVASNGLRERSKCLQ